MVQGVREGDVRCVARRERRSAIAPEKEIRYLDALVRGVYARQDLPEGHVISDEDVYLAIPLLKGQVSCRELMRGEVLLRPGCRRPADHH